MSFSKGNQNESIPVRRREDIGRIRDYVTYFSPDGKKGCETIYLGGIAEMWRMARRKRGAKLGQISLCSMAERVAAAREVTASLL
ncbi:MAG: hypothetical protein DCC55_34665, partial [Chloroflexi bacterium]